VTFFEHGGVIERAGTITVAAADDGNMLICMAGH
jgi:hypothetical protein